MDLRFVQRMWSKFRGMVVIVNRTQMTVGDIVAGNWYRGHGKRFWWAACRSWALRKVRGRSGHTSRSPTSSLTLKNFRFNEKLWHKIVFSKSWRANFRQYISQGKYYCLYHALYALTQQLCHSCALAHARACDVVTLMMVWPTANKKKSCLGLKKIAYWGLWTNPIYRQVWTNLYCKLEALNTAFVSIKTNIKNQNCYEIK